MNREEVTMVRIYVTEGKHKFQKLMAFLHDDEKVCGVTAFRGISGFGNSGKIHSSSLLDMSLDLPLVLEFYDKPAKVEEVLAHLQPLIKPYHIVSWPAYVNVGA